MKTKQNSYSQKRLSQQGYISDTSAIRDVNLSQVPEAKKSQRKTSKKNYSESKFQGLFFIKTLKKNTVGIVEQHLLRIAFRVVKSRHAPVVSICSVGCAVPWLPSVGCCQEQSLMDADMGGSINGGTPLWIVYKGKYHSNG